MYSAPSVGQVLSQRPTRFWPEISPALCPLSYGILRCRWESNPPPPDPRMYSEPAVGLFRQSAQRRVQRDGVLPLHHMSCDTPGLEPGPSRSQRDVLPDGSWAESRFSTVPSRGVRLCEPRGSIPAGSQTRLRAWEIPTKRRGRLSARARTWFIPGRSEGVLPHHQSGQSRPTRVMVQTHCVDVVRTGSWQARLWRAVDRVGFARCRLW